MKTLKMILFLITAVALSACMEDPEVKKIRNETEQLKKQNREIDRQNAEIEADMTDIRTEWGQADQPPAKKGVEGRVRTTLLAMNFEDDATALEENLLASRPQNPVEQKAHEMALRLMKLAHQEILCGDRVGATGLLRLAQVLQTILTHGTPLTEDAHQVFTALSGQDFVRAKTTEFVTVRPKRRDVAITDTMISGFAGLTEKAAVYLRGWEESAEFQRSVDHAQKLLDEPLPSVTPARSNKLESKTTLPIVNEAAKQVYYTANPSLTVSLIESGSGQGYLVLNLNYESDEMRRQYEALRKAHSGYEFHYLVPRANAKFQISIPSIGFQEAATPVQSQSGPYANWATQLTSSQLRSLRKAMKNSDLTTVFRVKAPVSVTHQKDSTLESIRFDETYDVIVL